MVGNETTVKPSLGYIADVISPHTQGDTLDGIAGARRAASTIVWGQAKLCCNNKQLQNLWGLKQQRFISYSHCIPILTCLEGPGRWGLTLPPRWAEQLALLGAVTGAEKGTLTPVCSSSLWPEVTPPVRSHFTGRSKPCGYVQPQGAGAATPPSL